MLSSEQTFEIRLNFNIFMVRERDNNKKTRKIEFSCFFCYRNDENRLTEQLYNRLDYK